MVIERTEDLTAAEKEDIEVKIGRRIGAAIARDVMADGLSRVWTGFGPEDADQIPDGVAFEEVDGYAHVEFLRIVSGGVL